MNTWVWHARENRVIVDKEAMLVYMYTLVNFKIVKMFPSILLWKRKVLKVVFPFEKRNPVDFCMWVYEIVASEVERGVFKVIYNKMPLTKLSFKYVHVLLKILAFQLCFTSGVILIIGSWLVLLHNHILHSFISSAHYGLSPTPWPHMSDTAGEASLPCDPATSCPAKWS